MAPSARGYERGIHVAAARRPLRSIVALLAAAVLGGACGGGGGGTGDGDQATDDPTAPLEGVEPGERTVQFTGAGRVRVAGTLTVPPAAAAASVPGVLILPAAGGRGDRNGLLSHTGVPDGLAQDLAGVFSAAGTASYRYDGRGTGESRLEPDVRLRLDDLVADARAGLDLLAQRRETEGRDLGVVAYDSGGLIALRLAATDDRVKRLVLISTPGRSLLDTQAAALAAQYGPESADELRATVDGLLATGTLPPTESLRTEVRTLLPAQEAAFLSDLYRLDPASEAARVRAPTLIVVPRDSAAYDPARLDAALANGEIVTSAAGGPTLLITGPPPESDPSDPASPTHEHGAGPPAVRTERDADVLGRITTFVSPARP